MERQRVVSMVGIQEDGRTLLVRKEGQSIWILAGGKPKDGEDDLQTLSRELKEEVPGVIIFDPRLLQVYEDTSPFKRRPIRVVVYVARIRGEVFPASEIAETRMVTMDEAERMSLSNSTHCALLQCVVSGYLSG